MFEAALFVTDFADAGVTAPVAAAVALCLLAFRQFRAAGIWLAMVGSVWVLMIALKFSFSLCADLSCDLTTESLHLVSPSGHVAASAAIYGSLVGVSLRSTGRPFALSCLAAIAVALVIGATRLALDAHSVAEVLVGGCVGVGASIAFLRASHLLLSRMRRVALVGIAAAAMIAFHGRHLNFEPAIRAASSDAAQLLSEVR